MEAGDFQRNRWLWSCLRRIQLRRRQVPEIRIDEGIVFFVVEFGRARLLHEQELVAVRRVFDDQSESVSCHWQTNCEWETIGSREGVKFEAQRRVELNSDWRTKQRKRKWKQIELDLCLCSFIYSFSFPSFSFLPLTFQTRQMGHLRLKGPYVKSRALKGHPHGGWKILKHVGVTI